MTSIDEYLETEWVPFIVLVGSGKRKFLCSYDGEFCVVTEREHPLLEDGNRIAIALTDYGEMAVCSLDDAFRIGA